VWIASALCSRSVTAARRRRPAIAPAFQGVCEVVEPCGVSVLELEREAATFADAVLRERIAMLAASKADRDSEWFAVELAFPQPGPGRRWRGVAAELGRGDAACPK